MGRYVSHFTNCLFLGRWGLYPRGSFQLDPERGKSLPNLHLNKKIIWPRGRPPLDVPVCGFYVSWTSKELMIRVYCFLPKYLVYYATHKTLISTVVPFKIFQS